MGSGEAGSVIAVIDYGLGNLFSISRALTYLGAQVEVTSSPAVIRRAGALVLPGVGAFGDGMRQLHAQGLVEPIREAVEAGRPLLGICLGMQVLFTESEEFGVHEGLGLIDGKVVRLYETDPAGRRVKVPHIGWSDLQATQLRSGWSSTILDGLTEGDSMYFVHSYVPRPKSEGATIAETIYGGHRYCAVVQAEHVAGCQFHPEKSGEAGLHLLGNFISGTRER